MKKILLMILITFLMVGCSTEENYNTSSLINAPSANQSELASELDFSVFEYINTFTESYKKPDNKVGVLVVDIKYPLVMNPSEKIGFQKIYEYYESAYLDMRDYISTIAHPAAKEDMKNAEAIKGHFVSHSITVNYDVTYQDSEKTSILMEGKDFTGDHINQWLDGKTFDLNTGEILELHEVLGLESETAKAYVISAIQAELNLPENNYNFKDFYLEDDQIVLFFKSDDYTPDTSDMQFIKLDYPERQ